MHVVKQFLRFGVVGVIGFVVDTAVLYLMSYGFGLNLYVGRLFSYLVAVTATWLLNRNFTFKLQSKRNWPEWAKFALVNISGGVINYSAYIFIIERFLLAYQYPVIGVLVGSLSGMFVNFFLSKKMVFNEKKSAPKTNPNFLTDD